MSHSVLVKNLHKEKNMMYSFHILKIWAYLAYKIEFIRLTLTFKNSSFVAGSFKGFMTIALHFQAQVKLFWKEVLMYLKDRDFK